MKIFSAQSALDVISHVMQYATEDNIEVNVLKLHCLLFIFYGIYGVVHPFKKLMPVIFVTSSYGPIEPNLFAIRNNVPIMSNLEKNSSLSQDDQIFLKRLWNRFAHHGEKYLIKKIIDIPIYYSIHKQGSFREIMYENIIQMFMDQKEKFDTILTPDGKIVRKWFPKSVISK